MTKDEIIQMALEADNLADKYWNSCPSDVTWKMCRDERFAHLVAAAERDQNTKLLYQMHERAAAQHNYYKHAAIEINRKARSQS